MIFFSERTIFAIVFCYFLKLFSARTITDYVWSLKFRKISFHSVRTHKTSRERKLIMSKSTVEWLLIGYIAAYCQRDIVDLCNDLY